MASIRKRGENSYLLVVSVGSDGYGDPLLTLSTCSEHTADGRFVVVAKKIKPATDP